MIALVPAPATLPAGERVYAVGDVHGCADRLATLHGLIAEDMAARPVAHATLIHLGDYIDRGEASAGVIERLLAPWAGPPARLIHLTGNHEQMMLTALDSGDRDSVLHWLSNGGADALASWSVPRRAPPSEWPAHIPPGHIAFLRRLALRHVQGGYVFVHAGLRPGIPLDDQSAEDMLWIREPFLSWRGALPGVVVHGHTPSRDITRHANRIGIDTGAVMGGALTCVVLEDDRMGFLQT